MLAFLITKLIFLERSCNPSLPPLYICDLFNSQRMEFTLIFKPMRLCLCPKKLDSVKIILAAVQDSKTLEWRLTKAIKEGAYESVLFNFH